MKHIELLGPPGSGKTTIAAALEEALPATVSLEKAALIALRSTGSDHLTRLASRLAGAPSNRLWRWTYGRSPDRFTALGRFIAAHAHLIQHVSEAQSGRSGRDSRQDLVWSWMLNLMARFQLATEAGSAFDNLLLDEGFCQRAVALFGYGFSEEDESALSGYLDSIPTPDVVILIDTPIEVCESRLDRRGWSIRIADTDRRTHEDFLVGSGKVVNLVVRQLEAIGIRILRVDGTLPTAETVAYLASSLIR